jgi:hypothetical protein
MHMLAHRRETRPLEFSNLATALPILRRLQTFGIRSILCTYIRQ